ncbi:alpha/beta hydrolase [Streptomyces sp. NPDC060184]|uniref:alpha/beta hydrolase n=1 Tax=Streptomyces sp. NPDC060184 TaxID=3347064 RepID=UPI003652C109
MTDSGGSTGPTEPAGPAEPAEPAGPAEAAGPSAGKDRSRPAARLVRRPLVRRRPGWTGVLVAVLFYVASFTPSLIPRSWLVQSLAAGVTAAAGYGVGAVLGWFARRCGARPGGATVRWAWLMLVPLGVAAVVAVTVRSVHWQGDARRAVDMEPGVVWWQWALVPFVALLLCGLLVALARSVRLGTRTLARPLERLVPRPWALMVAAAVAVVVVVGVVQGFLLRGLVNLVESSASLTNGSTSKGIARPLLPTLSGSPSSLESWSSLGKNGRDFVGHASTRAEISRFTGGPATDPVRVYVGLESSATLRGRADLAVRELERTGGFRRKVLVVFGTTGSGWVNESLAKPLEYMYGGDSAAVALQYSYLPSWLSFLTESEAAVAGSALFDAVYDHWSALPPDERPRLLVSGESLGSYATEGAFDGELARMTARSDGALLVGPTLRNPMWEKLGRARDRGSPLWLPVYRDGRTVRYARREADFDRPADAAWDAPRIVYLQNGSDPVTWWSPDLLTSRPQWLVGPKAPDVSPGMRWYPLVTFWQVTCDLAASDSVPVGYGHRFGTLPVAAWAAVTRPPGWTGEDTARLEETLVRKQEEREEQEKENGPGREPG